ncbi:MAG: hypothetical protein HYY93_09470 [Planctomycetes bacterium]|nr:hypothetical protein [Planctomycetota bacterium]
MSAAELRREGFKALCDRLGMGGAVRFLDQYETGSGDYTRERPRIVGGRGVKEIVREIHRRRRER